MGIHGDCNIVVQAEGTGHHITVNASIAYVSLVPPGSNRSKGPQRDLDLLDPALCAVELTGREQDIADLRQWLTSPSIVSVRALVGVAGSGKTRLAHELALELKASDEDPWDAGFLTREEARRFVSAQNLPTWGWKKNTLILVDDAAVISRELRTWLSELSLLAIRKLGSPRLRLLLLLERDASTESGWYADLPGGDWSSETVRDLFDPWQPVGIQPVNASVDRRYILEQTLACGAGLRGIAAPPIPLPGAEVWFDKALESVEWSERLALMMAALTALETGVPQALSLSRRDIAGRVALREIDRIARFAPTEKAAHLLIDFTACIILCGGLPAADARSLATQLSNLGLEYPEGSYALFLDLQRALPGEDGKIEPIRPRPRRGSLPLTQKSLANSSARGSAPDRCAARRAKRRRNAHSDGHRLRGPREMRPVKWLDLLVSGCTDPKRLSAINDLLPWATLCLRQTALNVAARLLQAMRRVCAIVRSDYGTK